MSERFNTCAMKRLAETIDSIFETLMEFVDRLVGERRPPQA